jgi:hypothetical protein
VALQPRRVPVSVPEAVPRDCPRDPRSISAHAAVGAVPESTRGSEENVAREFLARLRHQSGLDALDSCFRCRCSDSRRPPPSSTRSTASDGGPGGRDATPGRPISS